MTRTCRSSGTAIRRWLSALTLALATLAISSTVSAHPGHGVTPRGDSVAHYVLEPVHGLGVALVLVAAVACVILVRSRGIAHRWPQR